MSILIGLLTVIHVLVALCLIGLVLMQKSKDQGVGAAFGAGVTETVFGAGTTTALVKLTVYFACALLATTVVLAMLHSHRGSVGGGGSYMQKALQNVPKAPAVPALPVEAEKPTTPATETPAPAPENKPAATPAPAQTPPPQPPPANP